MLCGWAADVNGGPEAPKPAHQAGARCAGTRVAARPRARALRLALTGSEGWIAHAVAAVFQVAGETAQEAGIRIRHDREVVPAEALLELPSLAVAVARP